ncbi:MAG: hypothetical protein KIT17_12155 [Rubrivivax sp.]|nr:hypothetical protein [Rubrivivax sp.]
MKAVEARWPRAKLQQRQERVEASIAAPARWARLPRCRRVGGAHGIGGSGGDSSLDPPPSSPPPAPAPAVAVSVADASVREGSTRTLVFAATLTAPGAEVVRLGDVVREGTARSGRDYIDTSGLAEFAPGRMRIDLTVPILDDPLHEGTEALQKLRRRP